MTFITSHASLKLFYGIWCLEKREISTVSEFDEIRRGCYISQDDSNGKVHFIIRNLEKFRIFTEITILPFFIKLEFFPGFTSLLPLPSSLLSFLFSLFPHLPYFSLSSVGPKPLTHSPHPTPPHPTHLALAHPTKSFFFYSLFLLNFIFVFKI